MAIQKRIRLAMPAWEPGRTKTGFGAKAGGLGSVIEELPEELVKAAERAGFNLEIEILTPCFAFYDRDKLKRDPEPVSVVLDGNSFDFTVFRHKVDSQITIVYFWDEIQLNWTTPLSLYPYDPEMAFKLYASVSQAMAGYIRRNKFHTVHCHDYHVGLIPFYMGRDKLEKVPVHLTVHNATYQGVFLTGGDGPGKLDRIGLPGNELFDRYFNFYGSLNFLKAASLLVYENGGKVSTVSGDLEAGWGYAAELMMTQDELLAKARRINGGREVVDVFVPNCGLDELREIGLIGITNGLSRNNLAGNLPELKAGVLSEYEKQLGGRIFCNPLVEKSLLEKDHTFSSSTLATKAELKRFLHLEIFGSEPDKDLVFLTAVGRLTSQKNFELIASTAEKVLKTFPFVKYAIIANPPDGDHDAKLLQERFIELKQRYPDSFYYTHLFSQPHSRLMLAGGDFALIPSRFEPCGLVDYEACALGTVVVGHKVGGLAKVSSCAYLYEWLDSGDPAGEEEAFVSILAEAITTMREKPGRHLKMVKDAMKLDSSWDNSAETYIQMYLYGLLFKAWQEKKKVISRQVDRYAVKLFETHPFFTDFYKINSSDILEKRMEKMVQSAVKSTGKKR